MQRTTCLPTQYVCMLSFNPAIFTGSTWRSFGTRNNDITNKQTWSKRCLSVLFMLRLTRCIQIKDFWCAEVRSLDLRANTIKYWHLNPLDHGVLPIKNIYLETGLWQSCYFFSEFCQCSQLQMGKATFPQLKFSMDIINCKKNIVRKNCLLVVRIRLINAKMVGNYLKIVSTFVIIWILKSPYLLGSSARQF